MFDRGGCGVGGELYLYATHRLSRGSILMPTRLVVVWIPPDITETVCFLGVEDNGRKLYGGTGFFVCVGEEDYPELQWAYLVTAKHCVTKAFDQYNNLFFRVNQKDGNVKFVPLPHHSSSKWFMADEADVAIYPIEDDTTAQMRVLPSSLFLTDEIVREEGVGLGDDVFVIGLFREVHGKKRNFPIIRSGMIASMIDEPLQDSDSGDDYHAFLIELRSISGLSGSPVFMALKKRGVEMHPVPRGFNAMTHRMLVVGLIRGHWDLAEKEILADFGPTGIEKLNTGIAIVTPIQEVEKILMSEEFRKQRRADLREYPKQRA